jgi:6-phosphogluconate dehydrogenase
MATIWRGGCVARRASSTASVTPTRRVVTVATEQGVAIPAFSSSLSYCDGYGSLRVTSSG